MSIKRAMPEDAVALTDLAFRFKAHWGYDADFMASCRGELTVSPAYLNTELSGVFQDGLAIYGFYLLTRTSETALAELTFFFVDPEQIGTGVGAQLWGNMILIAQRHGLRKIGIDADPNAEGFYHRMGAITVGRVPSDSIEGRFLPTMEFVL